jgi:hypothetical protein
MAQGGARVRSGPVRDPNALRRERGDDPSVVELPAAGREGPVPGWPLSDASRRELELWELEWVRPQAVMWERNGQELEVALFVRSLVDAERPNAPTAARTLVRQLMDSLGLSVPGLARNGWKIVEKASGRRRSSSSSIRDRLKVVEGGE